MYKSLYSNFKNGNIKHFNVKNLTNKRRRFNLVLEPNNFSKKKNSFCPSILGSMKSDKLFNSLKLNHNIILQYDSIKKSYYLLVPVDDTNKTHIFRENKCGIDIGVRTFITVYSNNKCIEIGTNLCSQIDKYNKKLDKLKSNFELNKITDKKYKKTRIKYQDKINNKVIDMHKKVANYLLKNYKTINIGSWFISFLDKKDINTRTNTRIYSLFNIKKRINRGGR
jgi:transposase